MALLNNYSIVSCKKLSLPIIVVLAINHLIGLIGLNLPAYRSLFEGLAYINMLVSFILVVTFQTPPGYNFFVFGVVVFCIGMAVEAAGINTGFPFGIYQYSQNLGPEIWGVPVVIGFNWVLLGYACGVTSRNYFSAKVASVMFASTLMVVIDVFLEGFAIRHHFWAWKNIFPPLSNYVSWFFVSCLVQMYFASLLKVARNPLASAYLYILILFLAADWVLNQVLRTFY